MSLTQPPPPGDSDDVDRPPSRRFTILFTCAMIAIAIGYAWVWQVKTSRVVAEPAPALVLGPVTSTIPGHDRAAGIALRDSIAAHLRAVPRLQLVAEVGPPVEGRLPQRVYGLTGSLDRAPDGQYQLELRRTDARTDSLVYIYRVRGATLSEAAHRMAVQVAMSFGLPRPVADTAVASADQPGAADTAEGSVDRAAIVDTAEASVDRPGAADTAR